MTAASGLRHCDLILTIFDKQSNAHRTAAVEPRSNIVVVTTALPLRNDLGGCE